jgi:hypothetical protein
MRFAMVENVLIFVIHSFLATTVGIAVANTSQRLERMSGSRSSERGVVLGQSLWW